MNPSAEVALSSRRGDEISQRSSPYSVDSTPTNTSHTAQYSLFTSAERIARVWFKGQHGSSHTDCSVIFVRLKIFCYLVRTCLIHLLLSHRPFTTSTSSSSITLPSTTTPEHAVQSGQHDLLQEHSVHHQAHLHALPVEKQRHQEPLWRENQQSAGNLRKTFSTGNEPKELATKELATVSRISRITEPYQSYDAQKEFGERGHRAPITEEVEEFGEIGTAGVPDSKISEASCFQSQMHFDDSVESIADSDLEDGELQKMLTSPLCAQKALEKPNALFSSEQGNLIRSSVFRNADPSNLRGSLLEGNKDHLLNQARSDLAKQELHVESLNKCIGE